MKCKFSISPVITAFTVITGICILQLTAGCVQKVKPGNDAFTPEAQAELPMPAVPDSLMSPESRADYAIAHFWDAMDFAESTMSLDTAFMEQNFVNYIQLYDYATAEGRAEATALLMDRAGASHEAYRFVADIARRYLTDPNSPMRNEEYFLLFIHEIMADGVFSPEEKLRFEYQEKRILKNRPGSVGADFTFVDRAGKRQRLDDVVKGTDYTLVLFYDYDCTTCADVEKEMSEDPALSAAAASGLLRIVAVNVFGEDVAKWKEQASTLPGGWIVGYSPGCEVVEDEIYGIDAAPTIYLLDAERRVMLKDVPMHRVSMIFERLISRGIGGKGE